MTPVGTLALVRCEDYKRAYRPGRAHVDDGVPARRAGVSRPRRHRQATARRAREGTVDRRTVDAPRPRPRAARDGAGSDGPGRPTAIGDVEENGPDLRPCGGTGPPRRERRPGGLLARPPRGCAATARPLGILLRGASLPLSRGEARPD